MDKRAGIDDQTASGLAQVNEDEDDEYPDYFNIPYDFPCPSSPSMFECRCDEHIRYFCDTECYFFAQVNEDEDEDVHGIDD